MAPTLFRPRPKWDIDHLHRHLQGVVDLELFTIPFYMSVLYSIKDPSCDAYRMIQSAVYQEMLHAQLAANVANAFGYSPKFKAPVYEGQNIPYVDVTLDDPNPAMLFTPFSVEIGPLDQQRLNAMCLIEYPEWDTGRQPDPREDIASYGSIGEFYAAVAIGMNVLRDDVRGNVNQIDEFGPFYKNFPQPTVTDDGVAGYKQALRLFGLILDQGEGQTSGDAYVSIDHRNTADGFQDDWPHYEKFSWIRQQPQLPATYAADSQPGPAGLKAQQTLIRDFGAFMHTLDELFSGGSPANFGSLMATIGGEVLTCWQNKAVPRFS
jgi:hypothetical protein